MQYSIKTYLFTLMTFTLLSTGRLFCMNGTRVASISSNTAISAIEWTPCGKNICVAYVGSNILKIYNAENDSLDHIKSISLAAPITHIKSSAAKNAIAVGLDGGLVEVINAKTYELMPNRIELSGKNIRALSWLEGTDYLLVYIKDVIEDSEKFSWRYPSDSTLHLCDVETGDEVKEFSFKEHLLNAKFSPNGTYIALVKDLLNKPHFVLQYPEEQEASHQFEIYEIASDLSKITPKAMWQLDSPVTSFSWHPSLNVLAVLLYSGYVQMYDVEGKLLKKWYSESLERSVGSIDWSKVTGELCVPENLMNIATFYVEQESPVAEKTCLSPLYTDDSKYLTATTIKCSPTLSKMAFTSHDILQGLQDYKLSFASLKEKTGRSGLEGSSKRRKKESVK